jgi:curved DNA-binding protein CbpA
MKGTLSEGVLPAVLRELYVGRKTGTLHCETGGERRSVRLHRGTIINAEASVAEDHLGEMLVRRGLLTADDLLRATEIVVREKRKLGQVFIDLGLLDRDGLEDAIALQAREILTKVFTWNEGTYEFVERPEGPIDGELTLKLSTGELILEAVRAIQDPDVIRYALGDIGQTLVLSNDPLLRFQKLTLSPTDGFVLSRVDGTLSVREIVQMIPLPAEETRKSLFGLLCTGIIEVKEEAGRAHERRPAAAPPPIATPKASAPLPSPATSKDDSTWTMPVDVPVFTPAPAPAPTFTPPPQPPEPPGPEPTRPAPPPPRPPAPPPPMVPRRFDAAAEARRQEILDAHSGLKTKTHFEVLGIPRASTEAQVKEAYFGLAKRFHPDVHHDPTLGDLRDRLEAVFIRLGEAYETLRNPRTRASYEQRLGASSPRPAAGSASAGPAPPPTPIDPGAVLRAAELQVQVAEKHFEQEKYWDAIQALEPAVPVVTGKMRQRARVLLARAYLKNPKWVKRAEETLLAVVQDDDKNVEGHFLLGKIYKQQGLKTRSQTMLRRALELNPEHQQAAEELAEPAPEPEAPESGGGGFIRKLFGGKKG